MTAVTVYGNSGSISVTSNSTQPAGGGLYPSGQTPGNGNQTGGSGTGNGPGGIGTGDGGFDTPSDSSITTPSITFPNPGSYTNIDESDTVTSSAFAATGGRTHVASRWMIINAGELGADGAPNSNSPAIIFDSGANATALTALALLGKDLQHYTYYYVRVRYKASDNRWSNWSLDQLFLTGPCVTAECLLWWDFSDPLFYTLVGSNISEVVDLSGNGRNGAQGVAASQPVLDTTIYSQGAAKFTDVDFLTLATVLAYPDAAATIHRFDVLYMPAFVANTSMGFNNGTTSSLSGMVSNPGLVSQVAAGGGSAQSTSGSLLGKFILETIIGGTGTAGVSFKLNGVALTKSVIGATIGVFNITRFGYDGTRSGNSGQLAETRIYKNPTVDDADYVRSELNAKWGVYP